MYHDFGIFRGVVRLRRLTSENRKKKGDMEKALDGLLFVMNEREDEEGSFR